MAIALAGLLRAMGRPVLLARRFWPLFAVVSVFGAVLPGYFSFLTAGYLPGGVRAICIAIVPMFVLPMALILGFEKPDVLRALGVLLGAAAIRDDRAAGERRHPRGGRRHDPASHSLLPSATASRRITSPGAARPDCTRSSCCSGPRC